MSASDRIRLLGAATCAVGALAFVRPEALTKAVAEPDHHGPPSWLVRVLGGRQLLQGLALIAVPDQAVVRVGTAVDVAHAATMLALAALSRQYRRAGLASAATAAGFALASTRLRTR